MFNQCNARPACNEDVMEYCRLHNITLQAWGPLAAGRLTGRPHPHEGKHVPEAAKLVTQMAAGNGVSPEAILVAWILRHPARIQPLPGTTNPDRIRAAAAAEQVSLTREEWYDLFVAGRGEKLP